MTSLQRPYLIIGNWKMHKTIEEARDFVKHLLDSYVPSPEKIIGLAVPYTALYPLAEETKGTSLLIGAQNMNDASEGAFTGEIAGKMLKEAGASFVLLGHSERRHLYCEDDAMINRKVKRALEAKLRPILCIGETEEEHQAGQTHAVVEKQLKEGLKDLTASQLEGLILAYEPVWAIGQGNSASPAIAQDAQHFCRQILREGWTAEWAEKTIIQYGGSVHPSNAQELLAQPDIDGLLVGGASLSLESFMQLINQDYSKACKDGSCS